MKFIKKLPKNLAIKDTYFEGGMCFCFVDDSFYRITEPTGCLGYQKEDLEYNRDIFNNSFGLCFFSDIPNVYSLSPKDYAEKLEDLIHKADKAFGFEKTKIFCVGGPANFQNSYKYSSDQIAFFFFKCDKKWLLSPVLYNLFGALVRNVTAIHNLDSSFYETLENYSNNGKDYYFADKHIVKNALKVIKYMLKYGIEPFFSENYEDNWVFYEASLHANGMNLCNKKTNSANSHISEFDKKTRKIINYICRFNSEKEVKQWVKENSKKQRKVTISVCYEAKSKKIAQKIG